MAAGVDGALARQQTLGRGGRCLALLSVRNADLPREMDSVCEVVAALLERQVLRFADTVVLERRRLQYVNEERSLVPSALDSALRKAVDSAFTGPFPSAAINLTSPFTLTLTVASDSNPRLWRRSVMTK